MIVKGNDRAGVIHERRHKDFRRQTNSPHGKLVYELIVTDISLPGWKPTVLFKTNKCIQPPASSIQPLEGHKTE
jgi:hypothetical protein